MGLYCLLHNQHKERHRIMAKHIFCWMAHQNTISWQKKLERFFWLSKHNQNRNRFLYVHQHRDGSALHVIYWPSFQACMKEKYHILVGFLTLILFEREPTPLKELKYNFLVSWKYPHLNFALHLYLLMSHKGTEYHKTNHFRTFMS